MKFVKWIIIAVAALLGLFVAVTAFLPKDYAVERSIEVAAPISLVYSQVVDLEAWQAWNPWNELDPDIIIEYGEKKVGEGAWYEWKSEAAGNGKMTITETDVPVSVHYVLSFEGFEDLPSYSAMLLKTGDPLSPTQVTWTFEGTVGNRFFARWMCVLMDKFVGQNYEKGLEKLKDRCEGMVEAATAGQDL
jgi:hypothetical protein